MREIRLVYSSPCGTDRLRKTGYVYGRIHVRVPPVSARTGEAMLYPFSDSPTHRTRFARVSRVDVYHIDAQSFGLVGDKILQLPKGPTMQTCANPFARFDAVADMRQVFHADFPHVQQMRLLNDGLGHFVVDVFDMPPLPTGDSAQPFFGGATTVGLETAAMGKVAVTFKPQFPAAKDLATARGGEIVLPDIDTHHAAFGDRSDIGEFQYDIKKPLSFSTDQLAFLELPGGQQVRLMSAANERDDFPAIHGEQGNAVHSQCVSAMVEMNCRTAKRNRRYGLILDDTLVGLERFIGAGDTMDGITGHLTAKSGEPLSKRVICHMMQCDTVPAAMFLCKRYYRCAGLREGVRQRSQFRNLLGGWQQFQGCSPFHIGKYMSTKIALQAQGDAGTGAAYAAALPLPGMNAGVSRAIG